LNEQEREDLYKGITGINQDWIGYSTFTLSPHDISIGMLKK
jgi:hypothetical protein